jgi:DNA adenine methylase
MRRLSLISYIGGKYYLANWIISLLPKGTVYVEPFGGGASVLLNKPRHPVEVYNDINEKLVNLFRCIQDDIAFQKLYHRLYWTPASLSEFLKSIEILKSPTDPIDTAWAVFVFMNQVFSGKFEYTKGNWRRARSKNIGLEFQNKISRLSLIKK